VLEWCDRQSMMVHAREVDFLLRRAGSRPPHTPDGVISSFLGFPVALNNVNMVI